MKEAIKQILNKWGCHHDWERWMEVAVDGEFGGNWTIFHFKCKKCGKFKKVKSH